MRDLAGAVAVVTGGGSGIGLATATLLADAGVSVAVVDLDRTAAERTAESLGGLGLQADVGRPEQWPGIVDAVTSRFGGIDLAHLNAGVMTGEADIVALSDEAYRRAMSVNVDGVVYGVRAVVPAMAARGGGAIVATASLAGLIGFSPDPIYCLTKHAVVGLVRSVVPQLAEHGITINAVCPSIVDTPMVGDKPRPARGQRVPPHRPGHGGPGGGRPAVRRGERRCHGHPGRAGGAALPLRPSPRSPGRWRGGPATAVGVRRPRSGLIPARRSGRSRAGAKGPGVSRPGRRRRSRSRCARR